ncbi:MAG: bifunctional DNA-formamidopyrimidine glycosylase/DNA-(apurinic or apyrimidinic site) lyase [Phycisphaerales bacterium]
MPELPEVECVRRGVAGRLIGARLTDCRVLRSDVCEPWPGHCLEGAVVGDVIRHGKQIAVVGADGRVMTVQLGMTGSFEFVAEDEALRLHTHVTWRVGGLEGLLLAFRDPRRFGGLWFGSNMQELRTTKWSRLGPDALDIAPEQLQESAAGSTRSVKALLLDQEVIAGVGNIYADESLFAAGLDPRMRAGRIVGPSWGRLVDNLKGILHAAIEAGGSTVRDYRKPDGGPGNAQREHRVYGRGGERCFRCSTSLRRAIVAQRTTVWCPNCQARSR